MEKCSPYSTISKEDMEKCEGIIVVALDWSVKHLDFNSLDGFKEGLPNTIEPTIVAHDHNRTCTPATVTLEGIYSNIRVFIPTPYDIFYPEGSSNPLPNYDILRVGDKVYGDYPDAIPIAHNDRGIAELKRAMEIQDSVEYTPLVVVNENPFTGREEKTAPFGSSKHYASDLEGKGIRRAKERAKKKRARQSKRRG